MLTSDTAFAWHMEKGLGSTPSTSKRKGKGERERHK